jgi:hypothetical protein
VYSLLSFTTRLNVKNINIIIKKVITVFKITFLESDDPGIVGSEIILILSDTKFCAIEFS